jgi:L-threonylcarbamoyladenylate synthase
MSSTQSMPFIDLDQAVRRLEAGELVALPTETVYGLAGRIDREETLRRIFSVKSRPFFDPLIVHVFDVEQARSLSRSWPEVYDVLAETFWPGPLTLVTPKGDAVSSLITSGLETVAIRSPAHPLTLEVLKRVGCALAAPSANRFGRTSPTRAKDVIDEFAGSIPVLDGGDCAIGVESTVVQAELHGGGELARLNVLRPGGIPRARLQAALKEKFPGACVERAHSQASPGSLKAHYQPTNPVVIADKIDASLLSKIEERLQRPITRLLPLVLPDDPAQAARVLYQEFRRLSEESNAVIVIEREAKFLDQNWEAIWDRLSRAALFTF